MPVATHLRMPELTEKPSLARSAVYKLIREKEFPKPVRPTRRAVVNENEVQAYLRKKREISHG